MIIDESHVTVPQVRGMWGGDRARKLNLVNFGFRLPSALDNRPLNFSEFEQIINQVIYVSATPGDYELEETEDKIKLKKNHEHIVENIRSLSEFIIYGEKSSNSYFE